MITMYSGVCQIYISHHSAHVRYPWICVQQPSLLEDVLDRPDLICTWRQRSSKLRDALGAHGAASLDIHLETDIEWNHKCSQRPGWSEFGDALGCHDCANLQAVIQQIWRYTWRPRSRELRRCSWRPWSIQFGDALWGCDRASFQMHLQGMIERDWRSTCRPSIWREARRQLRLYSLVNLGLWECRELSTTSAERWETGWELDTVDLGMMLNLVYAVLCGNLGL
jgi:hypothetical protein